MSITSSVGLISGINYQELVDQLIAIDARPRTLVQNRTTVLQSQQAAFQAINAKLLALDVSVTTITKSVTFSPNKATSSNESVLTAGATSSAVPGTYQFRVQRLVSGQQTVTRGFSDTDATPIAPNGATLTFEPAGARLDSSTVLSQLNGGTGISRGFIRITDRSGATALIDLSTAYTVDDVLDAINNATGVNVTASVQGDGLVITDNTGQTASNLVVQDVGTTGTASSLGIVGNVAASSITGSAINTIGDNTLLSSLNDGNGVHNRAGVAEFRINLRDGSSVDIDLDGITTLSQLITKINTASGGNVIARVNADGTGLELVDQTAGASTFRVVALNDSSAAADLGLLGEDQDADGVLTGARLIATINSKLLANLNGGAGVELGVIRITNRAGQATDVDLTGAASVADLIDRINQAGAGVTASLNAAGNGLRLTDNTGASASDLIIEDLSGAAAEHLNLAGSHAASSVDSGNLQYRYITLSTRLDALKITRGKFTITDSNGVSGTVDLTQGNEITIADVLTEINSRGLAIHARINDTGDGILIEDHGAGVVKLKVEEDGSTTARDLGLLGEAKEAGQDLNGSFERTITIGENDTLNDLVKAINDANISVTASIINDGSAGSPYRLSLSSKESGRSAAFIFDDGGLNLGAVTLTQASDALVFFGASNPAQAVAISSSTNSLTSVIPGATINLVGVSDSNVQVSITRDDSRIVNAVRDLVTKFNDVIAAIDQYDRYDSEKQEKGLLLGDRTTSSLRSALFNIVLTRSTGLSGQYTTLAQIGITVASGGKSLSFDEEKFTQALQNDRQAVEQLFTFKEEDSEGRIVRAGIGVSIDKLLERLTDIDSGLIQTRMEALDRQISLNQQRIEQLNKALEAKRQRYLAQFIAMESVLAKMQQQSNALANWQPLSFTPPNRNRN